MFIHSPLFSLLFTSLLYIHTARAQTIVYPTTAAPTATALPNGSGYTYVGCWNETTGIAGAGGARALTGGTTSANNTMTTAECLAYCATGYNGITMQYAGLEYGRECWCGAYLSVLSQLLDSSAHCIYACDGNASEVCGGSLAITLYNLTEAKAAGGGAKKGSAWRAGEDAVWFGCAAGGMLMLAALL